MNKYKPVCKIGEGTFSDVLKTLSLRDGKYYACEHMKQHSESDTKAGSLSLICELMDMNIYELIKAEYPEVRRFWIL
ncbi:MAPK/MAK/MRK overlapping kinase [Grus japonensis]|uniref:MAPK/MAK/MRK overlapping kinase n=1 Tax=Grus japonensis TaxID=30415 RepID=A0ABC9X2J4_GRUJA